MSSAIKKKNTNHDQHPNARMFDLREKQDFAHNTQPPFSLGLVPFPHQRSSAFLIFYFVAHLLPDCAHFAATITGLKKKKKKQQIQTPDSLKFPDPSIRPETYYTFHHLKGKSDQLLEVYNYCNNIQDFLI